MIFRKTYRFIFVRHRKKTLVGCLLLLILWFFCLPNPLFKDPYSIVLNDKDGQLLGARIAADGQWRFPTADSIPDKFSIALIEFEDQRFYSHPGVDVVGIGRAMWQNIKNRKIVSGGSTLSMQLVRMARKGKPRTVFQKVIEIFMATRLELRYSKSEILNLYAAHAPMGGNVVGLETASWRYFGKEPHLLSWAEASMLAVLPNSPALIHPGRNRQALVDKRNRLLQRLVEAGHIDKESCALAVLEPLPEKPLPLPNLAPHLLHFASKKERRKGRPLPHMNSTLDRYLQSNVNRIIKHHHYELSANGIHNLAAMVIENETGNVVAYIGNVPGTGKEHSEAVDVIQAPRSTGSILKPFLYAMMLEDGELLPQSLVSDIPLFIDGYRPENFYPSYDGVLPADKALSRSLNVPMVRMLQNYGLEKFHYGLQKMQLSTINKAPDHYGLTLILGGAEAKLWDLTNAYACMARTLKHFGPYSGRYNSKDWRQPNYLITAPKTKPSMSQQAEILTAGSIWSTFKAMRAVERPSSSGRWEQFASRRAIAWKTGTSFGFRDAWAIGITPEYTVGVWAGNADGEGRPGLVGVKAAAPVLFDIFELLPSSDWFEQPFDEMSQVRICSRSGFRASGICPTDSNWIPNTGLKTMACPYHQTVHLDPTRSFQVNSNCMHPDEMEHEAWFVLPPIESHYYQLHAADYQKLPPFSNACLGNQEETAMQFIYPDNQSLKIYVPVELDGTLSRTVFKVAHREPSAEIHWHLDNTYLGSTQDFHHLELNPPHGKHTLTIVDTKGNRLSRRFEILKKEL